MIATSPTCQSLRPHSESVAQASSLFIWLPGRIDGHPDWRADGLHETWRESCPKCTLSRFKSALCRQLASTSASTVQVWFPKDPTYEMPQLHSPTGQQARLMLEPCTPSGQKKPPRPASSIQRLDTVSQLGRVRRAGHVL